MKKDKIIYWVSTGIVAGMMLFSAFGYFTNQEMKAAFVHLGFPKYFRIELGILKVLGSLALILPMTPKKLKDFAYFGFAITFISAFISHFFFWRCHANAHYTVGIFWNSGSLLHL